MYDMQGVGDEYKIYNFIHQSLLLKFCGHSKLWPSVAASN